MFNTKRFSFKIPKLAELHSKSFVIVQCEGTRLAVDVGEDIFVLPAFGPRMKEFEVIARWLASTARRKVSWLDLGVPSEWSSAAKVRFTRPCLFFSFKHKSLHHSQFIFIFWFSNTNQAQICFLLVVRSRLFELVIALFWLILSTLSNILDLPTCSLAICVARTEIQHLPCFLQMFSEKYLFRLWWVVCWLLQFHSGTGSAEEHLAFKLKRRSMVCVSQLNSWSMFAY